VRFDGVYRLLLRVSIKALFLKMIYALSRKTIPGIKALISSADLRFPYLIAI